MTRFSKGTLAAVTGAMVLLPAGAAYAGNGPSGPSAERSASTAPSPAGNPASKAAKAAGVCEDAVPIGTRGLITKDGQTVASVKQFYSKECQQNYGYVWVWDSYHDSAKPYDVTTGVYDYDDDATYGKRSWKATTQQEFWSNGTDTVKDCTSGVGTLRPAGSPQAAQAFSQKRCYTPGV